jgi:spermidine/putrescine transport system substrate-binding protein
VRYIGPDGEEGKAELEQWRTDHGVTLVATPVAGWDARFAKLQTDSFDVAVVANPYVAQWAAAGVLAPIDTSRLSNWADVFPGLQQAEFLADSQGKIYAVPIAWGDGPYVYNPAKVATPPTSIVELLDPSWKGRILLRDGPISYFHLFAVARGYDPQALTKAQLADVAADAKKLVGNAVAFNTSYQDATDYLVRGEADLAVDGWEAMVGFGEEKGAKFATAFFKEGNGGGWCDSMAIPAGATNLDASYAYIDAMISAEVNAQIAANLQSGTVNAKSVPLIPASAVPYDYSIVSGAGQIKFENWNPPLTATGDVATKADWDAAWQAIRAGG